MLVHACGKILFMLDRGDTCVLAFAVGRVVDQDLYYGREMYFL